MSFPVHFYSFAKKVNSTARPSGSPVSYNCVLKGPNSILSPVIQLALPITQAPNWNYCYIPMFDRYYFVSDWDWSENRLWYASLQVDVLATYKTVIGDKQYYVLRSATEYNPDVIDSLYPTEAALQTGYVPKGLTDLWDGIHETLTLVDFKLGTYIVGLVSNTDPTNPTDHVMLGGVTYYVMNWAELQQVVRNLIQIWDTSSIAGVASDISKFFTDPFQYIFSVVWFPVSAEKFYKSQTKRYVQYGPFTFDSTDSGQTPLQCWTLNEFNYVQAIGVSWDLPKHPQAATRGRFLKGAPFTSYSIFVPPFGQIALDPAKFYDSDGVITSIRLDPITGMGYLRIYNQAGGVQVDYRTAPVGVQIPMAQITTDIVGGMGGLVHAAAGSVVNSALGNFGGLISSVTSGVTSAVNSFMPEVSKSGGTGDFNALSFEVPYLRYQFQMLVDEDLADNGRPLCENWKPSDIPGYMTVENGTTEINGTRSEADQIKDYLETGFYYA